MPSSRSSRRLLAVAVAAVISVAALAQPAPRAEAAVELPVLFAQSFHDSAADDDHPVSLPTPSAGGNAACLTSPGPEKGALPPCGWTSDTPGAGRLQLTSAQARQTGAVFSARSTAFTGFDATFTADQNSSVADPGSGIAFAVAAVDPALGTAPATAGQTGGSLGYSASQSGPGLSHAYLGVGLDVEGGFSNTSAQGTGCTDPDFVNADPRSRTPNQIVVRGPGDGTTGYCALGSTAARKDARAFTLHGTNRANSRVPVEVVVNPTGREVDTASGWSVPGGTYLVVLTPVTGGLQHYSGALPKVDEGLYPEGWLTPNGYPKQISIGFLASTSSSLDEHEVDDVSVLGLQAGAPRLTGSAKAYVGDDTLNGDPVTYVVKSGIAPGAGEQGLVTVTAELPPQLAPLGASGHDSKWGCPPPAGQRLTCTYYGLTTPGEALPDVTFNARVTPTGASAATVAQTPIGISAPSASTLVVGAVPVEQPPSDPQPVLTPASGPAGSTLTVTGRDVGGATLVQVGTYDQLVNGSGAVYTRCPDRFAKSCFTVTSTGALRIRAVPDTGRGSALVGVTTLGALGVARFTYTDVPGPPVPEAAGGGSSVDLSWERSPDGGSRITSYEVVPYLDGQALPGIRVDGDATSTVVWGLIPGRRYTFVMSATNANGTSPYGAQSEPATVFDVPAPPDVPTVRRDDAEDRQALVVTWKAPSSDGGSPVTGYLVKLWLDDKIVYAGHRVDAGTTRLVFHGVMSGQNYSASVAASNAAGDGRDSASSALFPVDNPVRIGVGSSRPAQVGVPYVQQLSASGGVAPLTFATAGTIPPGLVMSAAGRLGGTPTEAGTYSFAVVVRDSVGQTSSAPVTLTVTAALALTLPDPLPQARRTVAYRESLAHTGGTSPLTFSITDGELPPGLSLDTDAGVISGTPTTVGTSSFTVRVLDARGTSATKATSITTRPARSVTVTASKKTIGLHDTVTLGVRINPTASGRVRITFQRPGGTRGYVATLPLKNGRAAVKVTPRAIGGYRYTATLTGSLGQPLVRSEPCLVEVQARTRQLPDRQHR